MRYLTIALFAAVIGILGFGEPETLQIVKLIGRQTVERILRAVKMRRERNAEAAQQLRAIDAGGNHALLDRGRNRLSIHVHGKTEQIHGIIGRDGKGIVRSLDMDVGHRKND